VVIVGAAQTGCGLYAVSTYSSLILSDRLGDEAAITATVAMGVVKLLVIFVAIALLERTGRRPLLLASMFVQAAACVWLAFGFGRRWDSLLLVVGFWAYIAGTSIGTGPVTFVYISEVLQTRYRAKGVALSLCVSRSVGIVLMFSYPLLNESIGSAWLFTLQAVLCFGFLALAYATTVETGGMSLEQMSGAFRNDKDQ
jgi:MFS family permease